MATLLWITYTATVLLSAVSQSPLAGDDTTARSHQSSFEQPRMGPPCYI